MNLAFVFKSTSYWPLYLGVLDFFHQEELPFHSLVGSGSGGWISALYSFRLDPQWMIHYCRQKVETGVAQYLCYEEYPLHFSPKKLRLPFTTPTAYIPQVLEDLIPPFMNGRRIEEAFLQLGISALDLRNGVTQFFFMGPLAEILVGTLVFPGFFQYSMTEFGPLVDPILVEPISISPIRELGEQFIIALYPYYELPPLAKDGISSKEQISRILQLNMARKSERELDKADLVLSYPFTATSKMDTALFDHLVEEGRLLAENHLAQIYQLLEE